LQGGGETKSLVPTSLFAFAAATLRVGDRLFGRQRSALAPHCFKVLLVQHVSQHCCRSFVVGVVDLEADALADGLPRAEEAGGFAVTAGPAGENSQAFEDVGDLRIVIATSLARW
jgi:hypothetical protein